MTCAIQCLILSHPNHRKNGHLKIISILVEIDHACKCLDNIKLTMDDLKKAWDAGVRSSSDGDETEATERRKVKKREKGKVPCLIRGELFYDDAYYHLRILGSRD